MSTDASVVVRDYLSRVIGDADQAAIDELVDPSFTNDDPPLGMPRDREGLRRVVPMLHATLDDFRCRIEHLGTPDADGWVEAQVTLSGRLTRDAFGGKAGSETKIPLFERYRVVNGRIVARSAGN